MNISVFCGASLPHSEQITEAARQLGRAIARGGHTLLYGGSNLGLMGATSGAALVSVESVDAIFKLLAASQQKSINPIN